MQYFLLIRFAFICFTFLCCFQSNAQEDASKKRKGFSIESSLQFGQIIKHTPKLTFDVPKLSPGAELNFKFQTWGKNAWEELHKYPQLGLSLSYFRMGDKDILGHAFAFTPNITLYIVNKKRFDAHFIVGTGISYLTQKFDFVKNNAFNAIGSHVNNTVLFKLGLGYKATPTWRIIGGFSFTHFSNGSASLPNFGANIPAIYLGFNFIPAPLQETDYIFHGTRKKATKRFGMSMHFGLAFTESEVPGGPKYPFYITSLAGTFSFNKVNRLHFGMAYEFDQAARDFGRHVFVFSDDKAARRGASRVSAFVGDEFLFGSWGIVLEAGYYLSKGSFLLPLEYYTKLSTRYYLPPVGKPATRFYLTLILKSHLFNAEYIGLGMGAAL